jgi:succinyl-CoA synthetase beta subunit
MVERVGREHPEAAITGFAVEEMCVRPGAHEVIAGIADDATFGPLLMVGEGGKAVEVVRDKALALPPLDPGAARALIGRTRMVKLLEGYRDVPAADIAGVAKALDALSAMTVDLPDIMELDINPLLVDPAGVIALDARVRITAPIRLARSLPGSVRIYRCPAAADAQGPRLAARAISGAQSKRTHDGDAGHPQSPLHGMDRRRARDRIGGRCRGEVHRQR